MMQKITMCLLLFAVATGASAHEREVRNPKEIEGAQVELIYLPGSTVERECTGTVTFSDSQGNELEHLMWQAIGELKAVSETEIEVRLTKVHMEARRLQDEDPVCQAFDSHVGFFEAPVEWYRLRGLRLAMEQTVRVLRTGDEWRYDEKIWSDCDLAEEHRHALILSLRSLLFSGQFALYDLPIVTGLSVSVENEEERGEYRVRRVELDVVEAAAVIESSGLLFTGNISWNPANALVCNAKVQCDGPNPVDPTTNIASSWEVISHEEGEE